MKVKLFTHTDLDGVGCAIVGRTAFKDIEVTHCDYNNVNEKIKDFLENAKVTDYDRIFITDISVNEETAENLDLIFRGGVSGVQLVDHHKTALWLAEKYPEWAHVRVEETNLYNAIESRNKVPSSGTTLFYKFLRDKHLPNVEFNQNLKSFSEVVRRYDTWEWHNVYNDDHPKKLNDLLYLIGREKFIKRFTSNPLPLFTSDELLLLEVEAHKINKYIFKKEFELKTISKVIDEIGYDIGIVFAEQYVSELGNELAERAPSLDFIAIIDMANNKVSLRGIHDYVDLSAIAKSFGGGGHPKASGFQFSEELKSNLIENIF